MAKARVQSGQIELYLMSESLGVPIYLGEIDNFKAKSTTKIIKTRPIGFINEMATQQYGGWDLTFEGGKVDWSLCHFYSLQENNLKNSVINPTFVVFEKIVHNHGHAPFGIPVVENYLYKNVRLFGLDLTRATESLEKIEGFASAREVGIIDTTIIGDPIGAANRIASVNVTVGAIANIIKNFKRNF